MKTVQANSRQERLIQLLINSLDEDEPIKITYGNIAVTIEPPKKEGSCSCAYEPLRDESGHIIG